MNEELSPRRALVITIATLVGTALLLYLVLAQPFAARGTVLTAEFGRAGQGLGQNAPVKVRGVTVGTVEGSELTRRGRVRLTMRLEKGARVPTTVTAAVEPASAFGPKYVNLKPGAGERGGPYLASGDRIDKTSDTSDLADLLTDADAALRAVDPTEVATIVSTVARGLDGQGTRLRQTLDHTGTLVNVAHKRRPEARRFLRDGAALTGTLAGAGTGRDLVAITGDTNALIATAAGGRDRLGSFADGVADLSSLVSHGLDKRGKQVGEGFRSAERLIAVLAAQLGLLGDGVRTASQIVPLYGKVASFEGPEGKRQLGTHGLLPPDPCRLVVGLCGTEGQ